MATPAIKELDATVTEGNTLKHLTHQLTDWTTSRNSVQFAIDQIEKSLERKWQVKKTGKHVAVFVDGKWTEELKGRFRKA